MNIEDPRPRLLKLSVLIMLMLTLLPTIFVPMFVAQSGYFTLLGSINVLMFSGLYLVVSTQQPKHWHRFLVLLLGLLALLPLIFISGGVNSQFAPLLPLLPVFIALLSSTRDAQFLCAFIVLFILGLLYFQDDFVDLTSEQVSINKSRARAIWLVLATLLGTAFGWAFNGTNKELRSELTKRAYQDELTGVKNRRNILEVLQSKIYNPDKNQTLAILMIDVDFFKKINDTYGHLFGDTCLQQVAACIADSIREESDHVSRYGGEEFLVILTGIKPQQALKIANSIRENIASLRVKTPQNEVLEMTATIGCHYTNFSQVNTVEELIHEADSALYQGKQTGRNKVVSSLEQIS
ncbi:GGDEF domain-containing protein [Paraglaciecola aquimarina]|uniref:diguanylate cyclase n=1 Tax=Paraglaciecola aquimarina TaxID=1235557 RepID=A0ABU3SUM1_9ALTE|nr:GGDEF domain-containing protein [Paraglaciecola aquimarina]MDU0353715.1 GGDEF domain-containing protein [Paraglaciecola aquimarina]